MNAKLLRVSALILAINLMGCSSFRNSFVAPRDVNTKYLLGAWIGYDQDCLLFYRLSFEENKSGTCVTLYRGDATKSIYSIDWHFNSDDLIVRVSPKTAKSEAMSLKVKCFDSSEIALVVSGIGRDWRHTVILHKQDEVVRNVKVTSNIARTRTR